MMRRAVLPLLIVLLGIAAAVVWKSDPNARSTRRETSAPVEEPGTEPGTEPVFDTGEDSGEPPSGACGEEEKNGRLTVVGVEQAMFMTREKGEIHNLILEEGAIIIVEPGNYHVWWLRGAERFGVPVTIVAGELTRVDAVAPAKPLVPDGFGVVGVRVAASWGGTMAHVGVWFVREGFRYGQTTDQQGCASVELLPGKYRVVVGDFSRTVTIGLGEQRLLEIQHRGQGDLLFDLPSLRDTQRLALRPVGGEAVRVTERYVAPPVLVKGIQVGFVYVKAGEYDVVHLHDRDQTRGGTLLGRVSIESGRTTRFSSTLPKGGLAIHATIRRAGETPVATVETLRGEYIGSVRLSRRVGSAHVGYMQVLQPGPYRIRCRGVAAVAEVLDRDVLERVHLELR